MKKIILLIIFCLVGDISYAQNITYEDYMKKVYENNLGYAAEQLNINIADAEINAAKVFHDPSLSIEYGYNQDNTIMMGRGISAELSKTFSFGKRLVGIELAKSTKDLSIALLNDYLRNLRAEATIAYLDALKNAELLKIEQDAFSNIKQLADGDSLRFVKGKISETDAVQSRLEAGVARNNMRQAENAAKNADLYLCTMLGNSNNNFYQPIGSLNIIPQLYSLEELLRCALDNRADLIAALQNVNVANSALKMIRTERHADIDLSLGVNYNTRVRNEEAPAPPYTGVTVGLSIPLKFSNFNKGTICAYQMRVHQVEQIYKQVELIVETEVNQNYQTYLSTCVQAAEYDNELLVKAKMVIDGKVYAYGRGDCSLLEVLDARRTYDDVRRGYVDILYNQAVALVELQRSVGVSNVNFLDIKFRD
ncbi:MAG: TolC family protein [Bacteroidales bacterium]